jgi:hypothetical protein
MSSFNRHVHYDYANTLNYLKLHTARDRMDSQNALLPINDSLGFKVYSFFLETTVSQVCFASVGVILDQA